MDIKEFKNFLDKAVASGWLKEKHDDAYVLTDDAREKIEFEKDIMHKKVDLFFYLTVRADNVLRNNDIKYVGDLVTKSERDILLLPNAGKTTLNVIKEEMIRNDLHFETYYPEWYMVRKLLDNVSVWSYEELLLKVFENCSESLKDREKFVAYKRIVLKHSLSSIAKLQNVTTERIRQMMTKSIRKMQWVLVNRHMDTPLYFEFMHHDMSLYEIYQNVFKRNSKC